MDENQTTPATDAPVEETGTEEQTAPVTEETTPETPETPAE